MVSLVGFFYSNLIYCFHLLDVVNRSEILQNVVRSITKNSYQLLITMFLGALIIYCFSILAFQFFSADMMGPGIGDAGVENLCETLLQCYVWIFQKGFLYGGGIAEGISVESYSMDNRVHYFLRFIFNISYFVLISVILLNVFFGVIIDTFAELRDERNMMNDDMLN